MWRRKENNFFVLFDKLKLQEASFVTANESAAQWMRRHWPLLLSAALRRTALALSVHSYHPYT